MCTKLYAHLVSLHINSTLVFCVKEAAMAKREVIVVIVLTLPLHLIFALDYPSYLFNVQYLISQVIAMNVSIGISLLLFPMFGALADIYLTRFRIIQISLFIQTTVIVVGMAVGTLSLLIDKSIPDLIGGILFGAAILCIVASIGIFEANAIQFGTDQLLDAPSSQLSAFIHWYFWSTHLGQQALFCIVILFGTTLLSFLSENASHFEINLIIWTLIAVLFVVWLSCVMSSHHLFRHAKDDMYTAKVGINPFKQMKKVFIFAWRNKHPLNRSAFTYCEEQVPTRLDLGKRQYGGPFTTEEVEDVKTFFRLLLLLAALFGYHISGDGFLAARHLQQYSCPSLTVWVLFAFNPAFVSSTVILISIPLAQYLPKCYKYTPNMLKRIGIGLIMLVLQDLAYTSLMVATVYEKSTPLYFPDSSSNEQTFVLLQSSVLQLHMDCIV